MKHHYDLEWGLDRIFLFGPHPNLWKHVEHIFSGGFFFFFFFWYF